MKGTLLKNKKNTWVIRYNSTGKKNLNDLKNIPLHPEDIKKYNEYLFNGGEVEFEIVGDIKDLIENGKFTIKYAKITEGSFDKEGNAITRGYVEPTESWKNIKKLYHDYSWNKALNKQFPLDFEEWLEEFYLAPLKRQIL